MVVVGVLATEDGRSGGAAQRPGHPRVGELHTLLLQEVLRVGHVLQVGGSHVVSEYVGPRTSSLVGATVLMAEDNSQAHRDQQPNQHRCCHRRCSLHRLFLSLSVSGRAWILNALPTVSEPPQRGCERPPWGILISRAGAYRWARWCRARYPNGLW